jgi:hypothetical protein
MNLKCGIDEMSGELYLSAPDGRIIVLGMGVWDTGKNVDPYVEPLKPVTLPGRLFEDLYRGIIFYHKMYDKLGGMDNPNVAKLYKMNKKNENTVVMILNYQKVDLMGVFF